MPQAAEIPAFDVRGLLNLATCFDAAVGGNVVNQSLRQYNDFDQLTAEYQAQDDAVNVGTTPMVGYSYADGAANTVRAVGLECPNGRQVEYNYGAAGGDGDRLSRVASVARRYGPDWATPEYDRAGNMTVIPKPADPTETFTGTYDAWNRLVHLSGIDATYRYDAFNRRVTKLVDSTERHFYYTADWQCLEERVDSSTDADRQYLWGLRYIDDLVLRDRDTNSNGTLDERLYALQDANWNVVLGGWGGRWFRQSCDCACKSGRNHYWWRRRAPLTWDVHAALTPCSQPPDKKERA